MKINKKSNMLCCNNELTTIDNCSNININGFYSGSEITIKINKLLL